MDNLTQNQRIVIEKILENSLETVANALGFSYYEDDGYFYLENDYTYYVHESKLEVLDTLSIYA